MSILIDEICQQPEVIRNLIHLELDHAFQIAETILRHFSYIVIAARGSSDNAARYAQYLFGVRNHFQVALATPSLFTLYNTAPRMKDALVIGISQSGQSPDIVSVIAEGKKQGCPTLAITNDPTSPLALNSEFVIPLHASEEKAIAATKTYTASLGALALISLALQKYDHALLELEIISQLMEETIDLVQDILPRVERYRYADHFCVIGRGYNYSTAFEIALKIKELNKILAEPYSSADFRHGPIATIQNNFPTLVIAPYDTVFPDISELLVTLKKLGAEIILISNRNDVLRNVELGFKIPDNIPEWLNPLVTVIPGQFLAARLAVDKYLDPDHPRGLRKVTKTK